MKVCDVLKPAKFATVSIESVSSESGTEISWVVPWSHSKGQRNKKTIQHSARNNRDGNNLPHGSHSLCSQAKERPHVKKKQQKNEKARLVWVKKENQGAQFVLSDKDQVVLWYHRITHTDKYSALRANYNDVKKLQCLQPIDHLSCPPWPFTKM